MSHNPTQALVAALECGGFKPRPTGPNSWESRRPAHQGERRNLSITTGDDGRALVHCHAHDCTPEAIVQALGMELRDLFPSDRNGTPTRPHRKPTSNGTLKKTPRLFDSPETALAALRLGKPTATWTYHNADGTEALRVARFDGPDGKSYRPIHKTPEGWRIGDPPGPLPLYRLPDLVDADRVFLFEGEKAAEAAHALGAVATTSAHGAGAAHKSDWRPLSGMEVVILPDHDEPGERYAREVIVQLTKLEDKPTVRIVRLPVKNKGDDLVEWLRDVVPDMWEPEQCRAELDRLANAAAVVDLDAEADEPEAVGDWPALALGNMPTVERFPTDVLPEAVADFVRVVAESIGCPEDFVGLPALVVAGAVIGRSASLLLKPGYFVSASLYGMNVGGPSSGKSPALKVVTQPLWDIDQKLHDEFQRKKEAHDRAKKEAKEGGEPLPVEPVYHSAVLEDCTVEAVAPHLANNPRGLMVARDEGSAWVASLNQYKSGGRGADRQFWLSGLFGTPIRVDRKGNPGLVPIRVPHPFLSFCGNLPPDMLGELRERSGRSDGFVERILFAFPDPVPRPHWNERGVSDEAKAGWVEVIEPLRARQLATSPEGLPHPQPVTLSPEAKAEWVAWYNAHADEVNAPGFDSSELAVEGKLCDFAGRLALILHLLLLSCDPTHGLADPIPPLNRSAVQGAIRLWSYFRSHHRRVRWFMGGGVGNDKARTIIEWIKRNGNECFNERDLKRNLARFQDDPEGLADALRWLAERHAIRPAPAPDRHKGTRGRKPSPAWLVHPDLVAARSD